MKCGYWPHTALNPVKKQKKPKNPKASSSKPCKKTKKTKKTNDFRKQGSWLRGSLGILLQVWFFCFFTVFGTCPLRFLWFFLFFYNVLNMSSQESLFCVLSYLRVQGIRIGDKDSRIQVQKKMHSIPPGAPPHDTDFFRVTDFWRQRYICLCSSLTLYPTPSRPRLDHLKATAALVSRTQGLRSQPDISSRNSLTSPVVLPGTIQLLLKNKQNQWIVKGIRNQ